MVEEKVQVNNANLTELKVATDDLVRTYFGEKLGYQESHVNTDVKLILGYASAIIAVAEFAYTWKKPFDEIRLLTITCVALYFLLSGMLTLWHFFVEKDIIFIGTDPKTKEKITIHANVKPYQPIYNFTLIRQPLKQEAKTAGFSKSFGEWFNKEGKLVNEALEKLLIKAHE